MILAIETSGSVCGVALHDGKKIIALREDERPRIHDVVLDAQIRGVCSDAELLPAQIDAVACSIGPGSFTGIRIGLSMAKGLCFSLNKPLVPVPTLDALAFAAIGKTTGNIFVAIAAEGTKNYFCKYDAQGNRLEEYRIVLRDALPMPERDALVIGTASLYFTELGNEPDSGITLPRVRYIADLGASMFARGIVDDAERTEPLYVAAVVHAPLQGAKP